jgi:hypothetical protein
MPAQLRRPLGLTIVAVLAVLQGALALLRSVELVRVGINVAEHGLILLPLVGMVTIARGGLVAVIALLYVLFAAGALRRDDWALWVGLAAALLNGLLVVNAMVQGASVVQSLPWAVVPLVLLVYLFAPAGRQALRAQPRR